MKKTSLQLIKEKIEKAIKSSDEKVRLIYTISKSGFKKPAEGANGIGPQDMTSKSFEAYLYMLNTYGQNISVKMTGTSLTDVTMQFYVNMPKHYLTLSKKKSAVKSTKKK